jgi:hypothetical protein
VRGVNRAESIRSRIAISVPLLAGVFAFIQSYRRWLDPMIDAGRDLYIPEQLRHGVTLYQDVLYFYPPLTPYLLAAITAITGSSLSAYIGIGLAIALLTAAAIWLIVKPLAGSYAASAALLIFFSFSVCGVRGIGNNYFFPYAHAATLSMLFFLWAVVSIQRERMQLAALLLVAASWTKIEYAVFSVALLAFGVRWRRATAFPHEPRAMSVTKSGSSIAAALQMPALVYLAGMLAIGGLAILLFGADDLRANVLPPSLLSGASARLFYAKVTGMYDWRGNLLLAARGAALIGAFVLLLRAWDRLPRLRLLLMLALAAATWLLANDLFFRAWTILQIALLPFALRRPREPLALLLLVSLCASSRIYLQIVPIWYGFVFITPVVILMVYVFFEWLPERNVYSRKTALAWLPLFLVVGGTGLLAAHRAYSQAYPVLTKRGLYYDTSANRARAVRALLRHLERVGASELVAMPEGLTLNYLSGVRTPLRYHTFTPVEIADDEAPILEELKAKQPRYVVLQPRGVTEFGYRGFGEDYGHEIVVWLHANYVVEQRFGAILLLRNVTTPRGTRLPDSPSARTPAPTPK